MWGSKGIAIVFLEAGVPPLARFVPLDLAGHHPMAGSFVLGARSPALLTVSSARRSITQAAEVDP
ncbi:hypothetical protein BOSEA31B_20745 [Hyphomicrobiales bacterium]|nr:hypothetical protein BOSEA31B_20745 [Hyphomicrobiales bacterium]CAH1702758.1 hypothetical protein BOSEA1005_30630 [Hyphomicrobiales bacterium]CAI0346948.1 hypothetical protein BO1005MUT1_530124 [Hyphomicrobiales bacterium]